MKNKIESLTAAQREKISEYVRDWTEIGLESKPADRKRAEAAIKRMYEIAGLRLPKIVWCGSPLSQGFTRIIVQVISKFISGEKVRASVRDSVWDSVGDSVRDSVYGQHEASWLAFHKFFCDECGLKQETEDLEGLWELSKSAGWALPHEKICWVSERHSLVMRDDRGRLHNLKGPALQYPDGFSIYAVHGVRIPYDIIENPESLTVGRIEAETNAEIRRVMIDKFGPVKYLTASGAKEIQRDDYGVLLRKEVPGDEAIVMVDLVNSTAEPDGSFKKYQLRVPPTMRSAREAVAWTFGKKESDYEPTIQT